MKKIIVFPLICFIYVFITAQIPDSLTVTADSLQVTADSLQVTADSLQVPASQIEKEATYSALKLKQGIDEYLADHSLEELGFIDTGDFIINENFHLKTIFSQPAIYQKNGFSYFDPFGSKDLLLQKLSPFQNLNYSNNHYDFGQAEYKQPVTLVESFLGLGDEDMNQALASMKKYEFLGIDKLGINAGYLGQEGAWGDRNESSQNFHFDSFYDHELATLKVFYHKIDEQIAGVKLDTTGIVKWNSQEYGLKLENNILDVGYRHDDSELEDLKETTDVILFSKKLALPYNNIQISYENFWQDNSEFSLYSAAHEFINDYFRWQNRAQYNDEDNYIYSSFLQNKFYQDFGLVGELLESKNENELQKHGAGLQWYSKYLKTHILAGKYSINSQTTNYARGVVKIDLELTPILLNLNSNWQWLQDKTALYPVWQQQAALGIAYQLPYGNQLNLNFVYQNYAEYKQTDGDFFKAKLAIDITNKFTIKAEAINPFNKERIKDFPLSQTHYIFGVNWFFLN